MLAAHLWTLKLGFKTISRSRVKFFLSPFKNAEKGLVYTQDIEETGKHKTVYSQVWTLTHIPLFVCATPPWSCAPHSIWSIEEPQSWLRYCLKQDLKPPKFFPVNNKVIGLSYFFKVPFLHQGAMIVEWWHLFSFIMFQEEKAVGIF